MPKLTKRVVEAAEARAAEYLIWDGEIPGFGVRIYPSGRKKFLVQYRAGGRTRRFALGWFGHLTAEEGRRLAVVNLGRVADGGDPAAKRDADRAAMTVAALCDRYWADASAGLVLTKRGRPKSASTLRSDRGRIYRHIVPVLGRLKLRDLTAAHVSDLLAKIQTGGTRADVKTGARGRAIVRGGAGTASKAVSLLSAILAYGKTQGLTAANVARDVRRPAFNQRTRRLTPDEYRRLGDALDRALLEGAPAHAIAAIRLLALTGCRLGEILGLRWLAVARGAGGFALEYTKTGRNLRPVGAAAFAVLDGVPRSGDPLRQPWVFPASRGIGHFTGLRRPFSLVMRLAGLEGITAHTLRHSFASEADDMGFSLATVGGLLGHAQATTSGGRTTGRYIHKLDAALVAAADRVSARIEAMMRARPVVPHCDRW